VSIKMAKEQGLSLNPGKISGICGRLLCCLQYEHECYECALKKLPSVGDKVKTPDGTGYVQKLNILAEKVTVDFGEDGIREYENDVVKTIERKKKGKNSQNRQDVQDEGLDAEELRELDKLSSED